MSDDPEAPDDLAAAARAARGARQRPAAPPRARRRPDPATAKAIALARFSIPIALVLGALLLALGVAWFALPENSPYKAGTAAVATSLVAAGAAGLLAAAVLIADVSRRLRP